MELAAFWNQVDQEIAKYDLLKHPFYQAWSAGELTKSDLKFYGEQYYQQVSAFPTYLTALHSRLPEGSMRRAVLANACEEECPGMGSAWSPQEDNCAHSDLWLRFVEGMDATDGDHVAPLPEISALVNTFRSLAQEAPAASAFGAFFAYESQVPRIASEKLAGLKQHYGADDRTCSYFALHMKADVYHSNVWRKIISQLIEQDERHAAEVLEGVSRAARALWSALDGIERERTSRISSACATTAN